MRENGLVARLGHRAPACDSVLVLHNVNSTGGDGIVREREDVGWDQVLSMQAVQLQHDRACEKRGAKIWSYFSKEKGKC
jgi:hypothetical protein